MYSTLLVVVDIAQGNGAHGGKKECFSLKSIGEASGEASAPYVIVYHLRCQAVIECAGFNAETYAVNETGAGLVTLIGSNLCMATHPRFRRNQWRKMVQRALI